MTRRFPHLMLLAFALTAYAADVDSKKPSRSPTRWSAFSRRNVRTATVPERSRRCRCSLMRRPGHGRGRSRSAWSPATCRHGTSTPLRSPHFNNDMSLSEAQVQTIVKWVEAGSPQGDPKDMPALKQLPDDDGWQLARQFGAARSDHQVRRPTP